MRYCLGPCARAIREEDARHGRCPDCYQLWLGADAQRRRAGRNAFYLTSAWRRVSKQVRLRDGCCVRCGATANLTAHHLYGLAAGDPLDAAECVTLCRGCHGIVDGARGAAGR